MSNEYKATYDFPSAQRNQSLYKVNAMRKKLASINSLKTLSVVLYLGTASFEA